MLVASFTNQLLRDNHAVGLASYDGESVIIPPRKGQKHALRVIREVLTHGQTRPAGPSQNAGFRELPRRLWRWTRRGLSAWRAWRKLKAWSAG